MIEYTTWVVREPIHSPHYGVRVFAAVEDGRVLSFVLSDETRTPPMLTHVYTLPEYRSQGIYSEILSYMRSLGYPMFHNNNMPASYLTQCFLRGILPHPSVTSAPPALKSFDQLAAIDTALYESIASSYAG